jgi:hypothetical protein
MIDPKKFMPDSTIAWFINEVDEIESGWLFRSNRKEGMFDVGGCRYPRYCTMPKEAIFYTCEECALAYLGTKGGVVSATLAESAIDAYQTAMRSWRGRYGYAVRRINKLSARVKELEERCQKGNKIDE